MKFSNKYLIINADDLGLNKEVNKGILELQKNKKVTSSSLLANKELSKELIQKIKKENFCIGVHLNIYRGKAILNHKYLTNKNNKFHTGIKFILNYFIFRKKILQEIDKEFSAQIEKLKNLDIKISHLDTEKHVHIIPEIFKKVLKNAKKHKIKFIRNPTEDTKVKLKSKSKKQIIKALISTIGKNKRIKLLKKYNIKSTQYFSGILLSDQFTKINLTKFLSSLKTGVTELSCHPAIKGKKVKTYIDRSRHIEYTTLKELNLKKLEKKFNFKLIKYNELK